MVCDSSQDTHMEPVCSGCPSVQHATEHLVTSNNNHFVHQSSIGQVLVGKTRLCFLWHLGWLRGWGYLIAGTGTIRNSLSCLAVVAAVG